MKRTILLAVGGAVALLAFAGPGCLKQPGKEVGHLDRQLATVIKAHALSGDPSRGRELAEIDSPLAQLGMKLFFSKSLSLGRDTACASCHHPFLGGGDDLPLPIGVEAVKNDILGEGRIHPGGVFTVPRNSPTTFNAGLWQRALFFDGRVEVVANGQGHLAIRTPDSDFGVADPQAGQSLLEAQARFPVTAVAEMRGRFPGVRPDVKKDRHDVRRRLEERLAGNSRDGGEGTSKWSAEFRGAFPDSKNSQPLISFANIARAISAYEESQLFVNSLGKPMSRVMTLP